MTVPQTPASGLPAGRERVDLLILGGGVAGLSAAVSAAAGEPGIGVVVVSKAALDQSATWWAQGGVAAVLDESEVERPGFVDSVECHFDDTIRAGAGLCDAGSVNVLVREGPGRVRDLARMGARFDAGGDGRWELAREGGHSVARVVHSGGAATGAEVERTLAATAGSLGVHLVEGWTAVDLKVAHGRCVGVVFLTPSARLVEIRASHTLLATGGAGQIYPVTTNPVSSTGDGIAMALRAGAMVADVEFVQFHPTALHVPSPLGPRVLLSEALRGEGAVLRDLGGERFVDELAPRDIVAAAVAERIRAASAGHVWLDVSGVEDFAGRFATLAARVGEAGIDPQKQWLPVAPAAHYMCGGVMTDLDGATTIPGLWAAGETACSGVHGANRLASNSLLEGMVFAVRAVESILAGKDTPEPTGVLGPVIDSKPADEASPAIEARSLSRPDRGRLLSEGATVAMAGLPGDGPTWDSDADSSARSTPTGALGDARRRLSAAMFAGAGVLRSASSLADAAAAVQAVRSEVSGGGSAPPSGPSGPSGLEAGAVEVLNLAEVAAAVVAGATARTESRGGHRRSDYPVADDNMLCRFVQ
ncbi:MAG: L-aspartate oxidase [Acidimicrobiales bacterium]